MLEETWSRMELMSAGLAHDIGHDLATVSCLLAAVRRHAALEPGDQRRLELAEREVTRVQTIVGSGTGRADDHEVSLSAVAAEIVEPFALAGTSRLVVAPRAEVSVRVDPVALWRLLANLVGNAVRAAGPDGQVRLGVHGDPDPHIDVHDSGPGFGFGPPGEAGLGLSTSRLLAGRCGAELAIESPPDGGTVVRVHFTRRGARGWVQ